MFKRFWYLQYTSAVYFLLRVSNPIQQVTCLRVYVSDRIILYNITYKQVGKRTILTVHGVQF